MKQVKVGLYLDTQEKITQLAPGTYKRSEFIRRAVEHYLVCKRDIPNQATSTLPPKGSHDWKILMINKYNNFILSVQDYKIVKPMATRQLLENAEAVLEAFIIYDKDSKEMKSIKELIGLTKGAERLAPAMRARKLSFVSDAIHDIMASHLDSLQRSKEYIEWWANYYEWALNYSIYESLTNTTKNIFIADSLTDMVESYGHPPAPPPPERP